VPPRRWIGLRNCATSHDRWLPQSPNREVSIARFGGRQALAVERPQERRAEFWTGSLHNGKAEAIRGVPPLIAAPPILLLRRNAAARRARRNARGRAQIRQRAPALPHSSGEGAMRRAAARTRRPRPARSQQVIAEVDADAPPSMRHKHDPTEDLRGRRGSTGERARGATWRTRSQIYGVGSLDLAPEPRGRGDLSAAKAAVISDAYSDCSSPMRMKSFQPSG